MEAAKEIAPMDLRLRQDNRDPEYPAALVWADANGGENSDIADHTAHACFLITSIKNEVSAFAQGAVAPSLQFFIKKFRGAADLGRCRTRASPPRLRASKRP